MRILHAAPISQGVMSAVDGLIWNEEDGSANLPALTISLDSVDSLHACLKNRRCPCKSDSSGQFSVRECKESRTLVLDQILAGASPATDASFNVAEAKSRAPCLSNMG